MMTRITRITVIALAALALATPVAPAVASDGTPAGPGGSASTRTSTPLRPQSGADTCAPGTRIVHGPAGTGCTTSRNHNAAEYGVLLVLGVGAAFALVLAARPGGGRRRGRGSTAPAFTDRSA
jgi:hypothetical protein